MKKEILLLVMAMAAILTVLIAIFETRKTATEKIVLTALMSSLSSMSRITFSGIPGVQPASFFIIMTGIVFGGEAGFVTGVITALTSNLIMGHGPWTFWQMFIWAAMGLMSGMFSKALCQNKWILIIYGFLWGLVFGWIMNLWFLIGSYGGEINKAFIVSAYAASLPLDVTHGVFNGIFLFLMGNKFHKIFSRISKKYGINPHL